MNTYQHSVSLDVEKCTGCTTCLKHCPTEAIRIRDGHAVINPGRCLDCGECIRVCPHQAKKAVFDTLDDMKRFKWKIALPAPSLYGQFEHLDDLDYVVSGLKDLGFDEVFEVARAAEIVSEYSRQYLRTEGIKKPVISSACPVIARLVALRFPYLKDNLMPLLPPLEVAAEMARSEALAAHPELDSAEIGVCFISPCPAKLSFVRNGYGSYQSKIDVVVSISDIYFSLINIMKREDVPQSSSEAGRIGIGWATSGGEATALFNDKYLAADGIENVIKMLDQIENGSIPQLEFIELNACTGGCVGGVMAMENPFIARARLKTIRRYLPVSGTPQVEEFIPEFFLFEDAPDYKPMSRLSDSLSESMRMMSAIQTQRKALPGIDCGSCGAPNCRAFAEDVVKGECSVEDCLIRLKKRGAE